MSLQSALLGYIISQLLPTPITPQENVLLQTTATATGTVCWSHLSIGTSPYRAIQ